MGGEPVWADARADFDGDFVRQWQCGFHGMQNLGNEFLLFIECEVEDQFVMHLKEHLGLVRFFRQQTGDANHCEFDHVGGGALDRHVDGGPLGDAAEVLIGRI